MTPSTEILTRRSFRKYRKDFKGHISGDKPTLSDYEEFSATEVNALYRDGVLEVDMLTGESKSVKRITLTFTVEKWAAFRAYIDSIMKDG